MVKARGRNEREDGQTNVDLHVRPKNLANLNL